MAKHASVLRHFTVETVQYDGWMELAHHWRECDWTADIDGDRITDLMRQATAHAKVCDGKRQPRPEPRPEGARNSFIADVWRKAILAEYARHVLVDIPGSSGADDALLMADPVHVELYRE